MLAEGYVYSQNGAKDPVARAIVRLLAAARIPIRAGGETRFGERITRGIVGKESDGSIDELLSSPTAVVDGKVVEGPKARSVIVVETPADAMPLGQRQAAHLAILENLKDLAARAGLRPARPASTPRRKL
jgi:hypothetical protein